MRPIAASDPRKSTLMAALVQLNLTEPALRPAGCTNIIPQGAETEDMQRWRHSHIGAFVVLGTLGLLASCTAVEGSAGAGETTGLTASSRAEQCFLPRQVRGFDAVDEDIVYVTISRRRIYRLQTSGSCPDIDWSHRIGIRARGGGSWVCQGYDAELIVPGNLGVDHCPVTGVAMLSEAEVQAYRARGRK